MLLPAASMLPETFWVSNKSRAEFSRRTACLSLRSSFFDCARKDFPARLTMGGSSFTASRRAAAALRALTAGKSARLCAAGQAAQAKNFLMRLRTISKKEGHGFVVSFFFTILPLCRGQKALRMQLPLYKHRGGQSKPHGFPAHGPFHAGRRTQGGFFHFPLGVLF